MANMFVFRMPEDELRKALDVMADKRYKDMTGTPLGLEVSVELIPDGIGYEATNLQVNIIEMPKEPQPRLHLEKPWLPVQPGEEF